MPTIKATVYLWTDELPEGADCWDYGFVRIPAQSEKGIKATDNIMFNKPDGLPKALLAALKKAGLVVERNKGRGSR